MDTSLDTQQIQCAVIWDLLQSPETTGDIRRGVTPEMFADTHLRSAYGRIVAAWDTGNPIGVDTLRGVADKEAYTALVAAMSTGLFSCCGSLDALNHVRLLRSDFIARETAEHIHRALALTEDPATLPETITAEMERFGRALEGAMPSSTELTAVAAADRLEAQIREDARRREQGFPVATPTGFAFLDDVFLGGFKPGDVTYMAARPSVGKTAVMLVMVRAAAKAGRAVKLWSLEMRADQLAERMMYALGGLLPGEKVRCAVDWNGRWKSAREVLEGWKIYIDDSVYGFDAIMSDIAVSHQRGRCDVAFIDYFQLMASGGSRAKTQEERLSEMSRRLKIAAMAHKIPVVVNSQLNRDNAREGRDPGLQDLRGSGALEQDADRVVLLSPADCGGVKCVKMVIGKNRDGGRGGEHVMLKPNATYTEFEMVQDSGIAPPPTARQLAMEAWQKELSGR